MCLFQLMILYIIKKILSIYAINKLILNQKLSLSPIIVNNNIFVTFKYFKMSLNK